MNKTCKKILIINAIVFFGAICFFIYAYLISGNERLSCYFHRMTGLYCPGCGGTRSSLALLRLDILSAVKYNAAVPFGIFVYAYYNIRAFIAGLRDDTEYFKKQRYYLCIVAVAVLILNFIVKNVLLIFYGIDLMA